MAHESDSYADRFRKAVQAGMATQYVLDVIDGNITDIDAKRLDTCWRAINKCVGDPPQQVQQETTHRLAGLTINHPK